MLGGRKVRSNKGKKRGSYRTRKTHHSVKVRVSANGKRSMSRRKVRSNKGKKRGAYGPRTGRTRSGRKFRGGGEFRDEIIKLHEGISPSGAAMLAREFEGVNWQTIHNRLCNYGDYIPTPSGTAWYEKEGDKRIISEEDAKKVCKPQCIMGWTKPGMDTPEQLAECYSKGVNGSKSDCEAGEGEKMQDGTIKPYCEWKGAEGEGAEGEGSKGEGAKGEGEGGDNFSF